MHHPTDRIAHTTVFVAPVVEHWLEREIDQWVHPMEDRSDDPCSPDSSTLKQKEIGVGGWDPLNSATDNNHTE